jgi:hypothetical protein
VCRMASRPYPRAAATASVCGKRRNLIAAVAELALPWPAAADGPAVVSGAQFQQAELVRKSDGQAFGTLTWCARTDTTDQDVTFATSVVVLVVSEYEGKR